MDLMKIAIQLSEEWIRFFGLYTHYAGYLSVDAVISLMSAYRYSDKLQTDCDSNAITLSIINDEIDEINFCNKLTSPLPHLRLDKDGEKALPKLCAVLSKEDISEFCVSDGEWEKFIEYLNTRNNKSRRRDSNVY